MSDASPDRQKLIESCQNLVRSLAQRVHRQLPASVDLEDLISYGQVGLVEAAADFDPQRGLQFATYAHYRIRGAIYDGLAKMCWTSRWQYRQLRYEQRANEVLSVAAEDATAAGEVVDDLRWFKKLTGPLAVVYLSCDPDADEETQAVADRSTPTPLAAAIVHETNCLLRELIDALPSDSGSLIRGAYFEGLTLKQAGERIGVSKAWASRLHAKTLQRLARALRLLGRDDSSDAV
jgi:RNA polymerase sigma factor for flagellar operon FliA